MLGAGTRHGRVVGRRVAPPGVRVGVSGWPASGWPAPRARSAGYGSDVAQLVAPPDAHVAPPPSAEALLAAGSLPDLVDRRWAADPARPVLFDGCHDRRWVVAGELADRVAAAVDRLGVLGARPGDRLLWCTTTSVAAVVANLAALRAGVVVVPANPAYSDRELAHLVADVRPRLALLGDPARAAAVRGAARAPLVCVDDDLAPLPGEPASLSDGGGGWAPSALDRTLPAFPHPGAPALVGYTSGTTGAPKGAVLTHGNLLASATALGLAWAWTPDDRLVHALPLFHSHGLCVALYGTLAAGASAVLLPRFDVGGVLDAVAGHGATLFFGVPTMYHRLAASGRAAELRALRLAVSGSAPLPADLHRTLDSQAGLVVLERYGLTETLMNTSNPLRGERRPGSVGVCLPGVEAMVDDAGEVLVRGPNVGAGYWERPSATAEAWRDGWFHTGDLATCDPDGYLRLRGRAGDLVISGGYNVYPAEVEDVLAAHPGVAEVAVTGTPSDEWGEVVTAWVVPAGSGLDTDELLRFGAERLAPYKRPRLVHLVDELPRTALGKVRRSELAGTTRRRRPEDPAVTAAVDPAVDPALDPAGAATEDRAVAAPVDLADTAGTGGPR